MTQPTANLVTIPAHLPFALTLVSGILERYGDDFTALSQLEILVPNRRSCRTITEAFLAARNGKPCLLPRIQPIGDVSEDDVTLGDIFDSTLKDIPPAVAPLERQMLLGQLIQRQRPTVPPAQILQLATQLASLIDNVHTEGLDWTKLDTLVPPELAQHWQITVEFLEILFRMWPMILQERGLIDPADRRNRLLTAKINMLRESAHPVIAAGSTGSIAATRDLLRTIAYRTHGQVVLSGLDQQTTAQEWSRLSDTHPQFYLKELIDHIGVSRSDVLVWPHDTRAVSIPTRTDFLQQCVQSTTELQKTLSPQAIDGITCTIATQPQQEAKIIALKVREALEHPKQSVLVVTPDRMLAKRVEAELQRWHIHVNDSAGCPLGDTRIGTWLQVTARAMQPDSQAMALLAVLHHPFASLGYSVSDYRYAVTLFEKYILRGAPWRGGLQNIIIVTEERLRQTPADHHTLLRGFALRLHEILQNTALSPERTLSDWLGLHIHIAEQLATQDTANGADLIWVSEDGEMAAQSLRDLMAYAPLNPTPMDAAAYHDFIATYAWQQTFRPRFPVHPRVNILSPIEARFQAADIVILSGLNETVWPRETPHDPFMSQPMREAFGLSPFGRRIGQSALDFYLLAHAPQVFITCSHSQNGAALAPSRWLQQMTVVLQQHDLPRIDKNTYWQTIADAMDQPQQITSRGRASYAPPLHVRPRQLSVSDMELWRRDPYALYAKKILRLRKLEPPESETAARDWGNFVHALLDEFGQQKSFPLAMWQQRTREQLERLALPADIAMQWEQRLGNIGRWLQEQTPDDNVITEVTGTYRFADSDFTVNGRADRIAINDNKATIADYKAGTSPSWTQVKSGYAPQLPFLGLILQQGSFPGIAKTVTLDKLQYVGVKGKADEPVELRETDKDLDELLERNRVLYARMIEQFDNAGTSYITRPHPKYINRYNDYEHLERIQEWSSQADGDGA